MPVLINDWDNTKRRPVVRYGVKCTWCGRAEKSDTPNIPQGWEEGNTPNPDGRLRTLCPECGK